MTNFIKDEPQFLYAPWNLNKLLNVELNTKTLCTAVRIDKRWCCHTLQLFQNRRPLASLQQLSWLQQPPAEKLTHIKWLSWKFWSKAVEVDVEQEKKSSMIFSPFYELMTMTDQ